MVRAAAVTIDVDSLRCYLDIHGLGSDAPAADPIYAVAMPRFFALLEEAQIPATLFLIGADAAAHADAFIPARKLGCEIASHSYQHDYRLFEQSRDEIDEELRRAEDALLPLSASSRIAGFRAPGYNVSLTLLEALLARGYTYDSSLLPAPTYWAARAAAIAGYDLTKRPSASRPGRLRAFAGPLQPYRAEPYQPWRPHPQGRLLEIPMTCVPYARVPLIGTSWVLMPELARRSTLAVVLRNLDCINFEMHAIDLLDADDPGVPKSLVQAQPDLRVPWARKQAAFRGLFRRLSESRPMLTLEYIAARV